MQTENKLGTEKISRLLLQFSVPTVMTLMVNCLYNIVDQIFIGRAVGITGMAATNAAFPMFTISAALALMVGDGTAANISLWLGKGQRKEAEKTLGNGVFLLFWLSVILGCMMFFGSRFFAKLFGASSGTLALSADYMRILAFGLPFQMVNMAFTAIIRADGHPQYAMRSMMVGAGLNVLLDPLLIFVWDMGVSGAAIATIIGQIAAGSICLAYISKFEHIRFQKKYLRPIYQVCGSILHLGLPSFCMQTATALTQIVMNHHMRDCGALTKYGSEIALSCYGVMMKIYQVAHAMFVGIAAGTQPINGYNYGAKKYDRVYQTCRMAVMLSFIISLLWFAIFQLGSGILARIFIKDDPQYIAFSVFCFHIYMLAFFVYGLPQVTASIFQAMGKPWKSLMVALSRQILFLIPLSMVLAKRYGMHGVLFAAPVSDVLACLLAALFLLQEKHQWKKAGILFQKKTE